MPFIVLLYQSRREGVSPKEFRDGQENTTYPWLAEYTKLHRPTKFQRHYAARANSEIGKRLAALQPPPAGKKDPDAAVVLVGGATEFPWDVMIRVEFRDELHFQQYFAWVNEPEHAEEIGKYEEVYTDPSNLKAVVIGEVAD